MNLGRYIGLLALIFSLYILWQIRQLLLLAFSAVVLAVAMDRFVELLQRWVKQRNLAIFLSVVIIFFLLTIILSLIVPAFWEQFQQLFELLPSVFVQIQAGIDWLENFLSEQDFLDFPDLDSVIQQFQPYVYGLFQQSFNFFSDSVGAILQLLLVLVLSLMLLVNPRPYHSSFIRLFPSFYCQRAQEIIFRCHRALGSWTTGILIQMSFIAVLSGIGLWILQVPLALAHAVLAGLLDLIPNIGPTLSAVFPIAIALLDSPGRAIAVLIFYIALQNIESYWLTPSIMAKQVSLLPAVTLISQIVFASFFGALGLVMALPLTVVAKTWLEELLFKEILDKWKYASRPSN
jgi:predicted PurR-regulated permease PerM